MPSIEQTQSQIKQAQSELNPKSELLDLLKYNALQAIDSKLDALNESWSIEKYKLVVIGTIGSGKTTALCYLLDLLDNDPPPPGKDPLNLFKEELLVTGAGGSTVCEVHLKLSDTSKSHFETVFISKKELYASLDDFAEFIAAKVDDKEGTIGSLLPQEITRAIRNITGLKRIEGNDLAIDKYTELGSYENLKQYLFDFVKDLPGEESPQILLEDDPLLKGKKFIKEGFKRINSSEIDRYSIPKQITIYLSKEIFGEHPIWNVFNEIIDTKGLDGVSGREDIDGYFKDSASIMLFTSTFPNAPSSDIVYQIEKFTQSSLGEKKGNLFRDKSLMLVLPRGNEPAEKVGAEGDYTEGLAIAKEHIENKMRTLDNGIKADRILFFNAKGSQIDSKRDGILTTLTDVTHKLKDKNGELTELQITLDKILEFDEIAEASKQSLINTLKSIRLSEFIYTDTNYADRYAEKFSEWFPHWNTKHALNKRKGIWGGTSVFSLGRIVFIESIRSALQEKITGIVDNLQATENQGLAPLIQPIINLINQEAGDWSRKLQKDFYLHLKENEFHEDNVFWIEVINRKIRGNGYNERIVEKYQEQLSSSASAYIQNLVMTKWEELLTKIGDLLGGQLLGAEIEQMMEYELREISIENFQGISKIEKLAIPENSKCVILTGENGYGKTSILRGVLAGFIGKNDGNFRLIEDDASKISVKYKDPENIKERTLDSNEASFASVVAYGANRGGMNGSVRDPKSYHLFNENAEFINIEEELMKLENGTEQQQTYFKSIRLTLLNFLNEYIEDIKIHREGGSTMVLYREKGKNVFIPFDRLATGFKTVIGLVGDMIWRLANSEFNNLKTLTGIVIIDEFDLHLHPIWQKELLITLNKTFPKVQFIISTHSPIPFLGAPVNTAVIEVGRNEEANITAQLLDIDFSNLQPNAVLTSPIFKFKNLIPYAHKGDKFLKTEDYYVKILQQESAEDKVKAYLTDQKTQDILAKLNLQSQKE